MSATQFPVLTVGHSNHSSEELMKLLLRRRVDEVADVRSSPYSRYTPHFNRDILGETLEQCGIGYAFLGGELGGRPADRSCYDANGRVQYEKLADTDEFDDGIRKIIHAAEDRRIVLMCTEKEPLECHRTLLVGRALVERGVVVEHILAGGRLENHDAAMDRLMDLFKLPRNGDMFRSRIDVVADALTRQAKKVAYVGEKISTISDDLEHVF